MPIITAIKKQQRAGRFSIFIDGKYNFSCPEFDLPKLKIIIGQEINKNTLIQIKQQVESVNAIDKALHYLDIGPRSIYEMKRYLKRKGYKQNRIDQVLNYLQKNNFLNDQTFALSWIEMRKLLNPRSKKQLFLELRQKGIERHIIESALEGYNLKNEEEALKHIIQKKIHLYQEKTKLIQYLMRKGFNYQLIKKNINSQKD